MKVDDVSAYTEDHPWIRGWLAAKVEFERDDLRKWIATRPPAVADAATRFPPTAIVRTREDAKLMIPPPGSVAIVFSYTERPTGEVFVVVSCCPSRCMLAECRPEELELIATRPGLGPDDLQREAETHVTSRPSQPRPGRIGGRSRRGPW